MRYCLDLFSIYWVFLFENTYAQMLSNYPSSEDTNKCLLVLDRKWVANQKNNADSVQLGEPICSLGLLIRVWLGIICRSRNTQEAAASMESPSQADWHLVRTVTEKLSDQIAGIRARWRVSLLKASSRISLLSRNLLFLKLWECPCQSS